jgi:hypothetical protein
MTNCTTVCSMCHCFLSPPYFRLSLWLSLIRASAANSNESYVGWCAVGTQVYQRPPASQDSRHKASKPPHGHTHQQITSILKQQKCYEFLGSYGGDYWDCSVMGCDTVWSCSFAGICCLHLQTITLMSPAWLVFTFIQYSRGSQTFGVRLAFLKLIFFCVVLELERTTKNHNKPTPTNILK